MFLFKRDTNAMALSRWSDQTLALVVDILLNSSNGHVWNLKPKDFAPKPLKLWIPNDHYGNESPFWY